MFIIMLGAPGTGKGTVGRLLSEELGVVHISSGEIFRSYIKKYDEIGRKINEYISKGLLVPDELAIKLVEKRLSEPDVKNGAILDGYPRTEKQAIELEELLNYKNQKVNVAVDLSLSDEEVIDRITKRRTCPNTSCREIYNLDFKKPLREGICDKCGSELIIRSDDNEQTVKQRLEIYHKVSAGLIKYYKNQNILYTVKLNNSSETTSKDVAKEIQDYLKCERT